jgi:penicillin-binding protein 2
MDDQSRHELFGIREDGVGMRVNPSDQNVVKHEVLFEDDVTSMKEQPMYIGSPIPRSRYIVGMIVVLLCVGGLIGRAFWMQVVQGAAFAERADQNRLRHVVVEPKRGIIRDRNGITLADNIPSFDVQVIPRLLPKDSSERDILLGRIGRETGLAIDDLRQSIEAFSDPDKQVTLVRDVPYDRAIALSILTGDDPAFSVVTGRKRRYPLSPTTESLSHILGYIGPVTSEDLAKEGNEYRQTDSLGKSGIEASYESSLRGIAGEKVYEVDARNRITSLVSEQPAVDGKDVTLTLDERLQAAAERAMKAEMEKAHLSRGSVVVMDPRDGSILALVSLPAYDNNYFSGHVSSTYYASLLKNDDHPLLARAIAGVFPSGSTIKPAIATAALTEGVITPETTVNSVGGIRVGGILFPDWKAGGHGITNVRKAIAWSVNSFFYYIGGGYQGFVGLGVDRLSSWMKKFGLSQKTGIDLPGESSGFVPTKEWKEKSKGEHWYIGDTYNLSIGQGDLLVTPLQIANVTSEIANGGHRLIPHVSTSASSTPSDSSLIADAAAIKTVQLGMRDTVIYGSGRALVSLPVAVAGKTGTAQWRNDKANHAWFTCFAPADKPEIVVTVLLEEGVEGSYVSVPVTREILNEWIKDRGAATSTSI